ncbi:MAG: translation initiation factor [Flavobacteriaceae bacterium]
MDFKDQLKNLFPDHIPAEPDSIKEAGSRDLWMQDEPIICKYEKRKGKSITILEGYKGSDKDLKSLSKALKSKLHVGGTVKNSTVIIQGDLRDKIMEILQGYGFNTKRVGG